MPDSPLISPEEAHRFSNSIKPTPSSQPSQVTSSIKVEATVSDRRQKPWQRDWSVIWLLGTVIIGAILLVLLSLVVNLLIQKHGSLGVFLPFLDKTPPQPLIIK